MKCFGVLFCSTVTTDSELPRFITARIFLSQFKSLMFTIHFCDIRTSPHCALKKKMMMMTIKKTKKEEEEDEEEEEDDGR